MQLFDQDLVRMTFIVGIAVSVLMYEKTHTTTGSLVVPGYVGAQLLNPIALITTGINAWLTFVLVSRVLPRYAAVYGRARFVTNILVSVLISLALGPMLGSVTGPSLPLLDTIGYVIPALIAYDMNRQGPTKTLTAVSVGGALAALPALLLVVLMPSRIDPFLPVETGLLAVGDVWFPIVALVSTGVSTMLFNNHQLRSGGFIGPMYLGLSAVRPEQGVYFLVMAGAVYLAVHVGLKRVMILFGRRKFAVMLMTGSLMSWTVLEVIESVRPGSLNINGLPIAALFIPALLANDMERTSVGRVVVGGFIAGAATLSLVVVTSGVVDQVPLPFWALPLLLISMAALFWPHVESRLALRLPDLRRPIRPVRIDLPTKRPVPRRETPRHVLPAESEPRRPLVGIIGEPLLRSS